MTKVLLVCVVLGSFGCKGKNNDKQEPPAGSGSAATSGSAADSAGSAADSAGSAGSADSAGSDGSDAPAAPPSTPSTAGGKVSNEAAHAQDLPCDKQARNVEGNEGTSWYMRCPACPKLDAPVWGTDLYTDDSRLCLAAIHAGAITKTGGMVLVTWVSGQPTYVGSVRNGVTTNDFGEWGRSFFVQSVNAQGVPTSPPVKPLPEGTIKVGCRMTANVWTKKEPVRVQCPPGCNEGPLWGTDVYSADSMVCAAAVHAGIITASAGGEFRMIPGGKVDKLTGSEKNGVVSDDFGAYDDTFKLAR